MFTSLTPAFKAAAEIEQTTSDTISFIESRLKYLHSLASDPEVLTIFGTNAVSALTAYSVFVDALTAVKPDHTAPKFDLEVFQPQPDGSINYVPPANEPA